MRVEPESVAGPETRVKATGKPEVAVAARVSGASPKLAEAGEIVDLGLAW
jgi:hypothetical protein